MSTLFGRRGAPTPALSTGRVLLPGMLSLLLFGSTAETWAQAQPLIQHEAIECILNDQYVELHATIEPPSDIRVARVYFRSELYPEFYYVEMSGDGDQFQAVLPRPAEETKQVIYYIEAVNHAFLAAQTLESSMQVVTAESECERRGPNPIYFAGTNPGIIIGATSSSVSAIPPGFQIGGIVSTITSAGAAAGVGGGIGAGTAAGIAAAGGAATGAAVLAGGGRNDAPTTSVPVVEPPASTTTSAPAAAPGACFVTTPNPPVVGVNESVRFDAECSRASGSGNSIVSYEWDFRDGRAGATGRVVSRLFTEEGTFMVTLTVTDEGGAQDSVSKNVVVESEPPPPGTTTTSTSSTTSTTTTSIPNLADVSVTKSGPPSVSAGTDFDYVVQVSNAGPRAANTVRLADTIAPAANVTIVNISFTGPVNSCTIGRGNVVICTASQLAPGASFTLIVTVRITGPVTNSAEVTSASPPDPNPGNNNAGVSTGIALRTLEGGSAAVDATVTTHLELPPADGRVKGQILFNGSDVDPVDNRAPYRHSVAGRVGENTVEATLLTPPESEGRWRFDFREAPLEPGSISVDSGQALSVGPKEIVFRAGAQPGEVIRFRFRLRER